MPALALCAFGSLFVLGLIDNSRGPFYPEILQEFGVSATQGSLFFALVSLFSFLGSTLAHRWVNRWSSLNLLVASSMMFSIGFVFIALAPSWWTLCLACSFFGFAFGGLNVSQNTLVLEVASPAIRRRMLSGLHSMYGLAALLAPLCASAFRHVGFGWRMSFLVLALLPWVLLAIMGKTLKGGSHRREVGVVLPLHLSEWKMALFYALVLAGYLWSEIAVSTRMVTWLRTELNYSPDIANLYMCGFFCCLLSGRLLFSLVHFPSLTNWDVLQRSSVFAVILLVLGLSVNPLFLVLSGFAMAPFFPVSMDQINSQFGEKASQAVGFAIGFGALSVVIMHLAVGWITDHWGLTVSFYICTFLLGLVGLTLKLFPQKATL